jgi:hypothetical protein
MINSLDPHALNPANPKPKDMTDDQKFTFFVRAVWLDPFAYDILAKMHKVAKD